MNAGAYVLILPRPNEASVGAINPHGAPVTRASAWTDRSNNVIHWCKISKPPVTADKKSAFTKVGEKVREGIKVDEK